IKQHLKDKHAGRWNRFSLYLVRKVDHIKEIESLLLRIADPAGNKQGGRLRRAENLDLRLRRMMQNRQQEELDEIFADRPSRHRGLPKTPRQHKGTRKSIDPQRPLKGVVRGGKRIYATYKGREYKAIVCNNGQIKFGGEFYDSPSAAAQAIRKGATNGWSFWRIRRNGESVRLSELRKKV
ncbi:MAG: DUF2924 domain-containing protein, partial [Phycisphaerae bacterium]